MPLSPEETGKLGHYPFFIGLDKIPAFVHWHCPIPKHAIPAMDITTCA
jgi:hypothetical protein